MSAGEITVRQGTDVAEFDPSKAKVKDAKLNAVIEYAKEVKDWPLLTKAVDTKIDEQKRFVEYWDVVIRPALNPNLSNAVPHDLGASPKYTVQDIETHTGIKQYQVSRWAGYTQDDEAVDKYRKKLYGRAYAEAFGVVNGSLGSGKDEWYTPAEYIEAARKVLGSIELDPASSAIAQKTVKAKRYFSIENDALKQTWKAKTAFMNPPYSAANIFHFVDKLVTELTAGNIGSAIMLTNNYTDTAWFHRAEEIAIAMCFTRGRIRYVDADGNESAPTNGQCFFYFGERADRFGEVFREHGFIR